MDLSKAPPAMQKLVAAGFIHNGYAKFASSSCADYTPEAYASSPESTPDSAPGRLMATFT
jgi:hypothetical protein